MSEQASAAAANVGTRAGRDRAAFDRKLVSQQIATDAGEAVMYVARAVLLVPRNVPLILIARLARNVAALDARIKSCCKSGIGIDIIAVVEMRIEHLVDLDIGPDSGFGPRRAPAQQETRKGEPNRRQGTGRSHISLHIHNKHRSAVRVVPGAPN